MKKSGFLLTALASAFLSSTAAQAVTVMDGRYDGTSDDGQNIELVVGTNPDTGNQGVVSATVSFSAACRGRGTGITLSSGWGFAPNSDLTDNKAAFDVTNSYFDTNIRATFKADGEVTGTIGTRTPTLVPSSDGRPHFVALCETLFHHFSLTYVGTANKTAPAKGTMVLFSKP